MVFFVLSGFVIGYSIGSKGGQLKTRTYFLGRFRRIYPIMVLVMLASYLIMELSYGAEADFQWKDFVGNLLQLQDAPHPGRAVAPYMYNFVLWSLAYECWFYLVFYLLYRGMPGRARAQDIAAVVIATTGQLSYVLYPNPFSMFASYFMLWWAGLLMAREYLATGQVSFRKQWPAWAIILVLGMGWWLVNHFQIGRPTDFGTTEYPHLQARHFFSVILVLGLGYGWYKLGFPLYRYVLRPFRHFAGISYALYISHLVIIRVILDAYPAANAYLSFAVILPTTLIVAWVLEQPYQRLFNRWLR